MYKVKDIQNALIDKIHSNLDSLFDFDTEELGAVIDMIKDLSETMYYCAKAKSKMNKTPEQYLEDLDDMIETANDEDKEKVHVMLKKLMNKLEK